MESKQHELFFSKHVEPTSEQPKSGYRDYWDESGMVNYADGIAWGLDSQLRSIPLGREADVVNYLRTGVLPDYIKPTQRLVLVNIRKHRQEEGIGESESTSGFRKRNLEGSGHTRSTRSYKSTTGPSAKRARISRRSTRAAK